MSESVWCAGCSRYFADAKAFELHANGTRRPAPRHPRRCRTEAELRALGMRQDGASTWIIADAKARKV